MQNLSSSMYNIVYVLRIRLSYNIVIFLRKYQEKEVMIFSYI